MICKAVIFDLDGTLLDTLADLANSANRVLAGHGYPTHPIADYKRFIGDGSRMLITRALPEERRLPEIIDASLEAFVADYGQHWDSVTQPYDGIIDLIGSFKESAMPMGVVTNKPHRFTAVMTAYFFEGCPFYPILGQQDHIPKKPNPHQALVAAEKMGVAPSSCVFLGDSAVDMETAKSAGMHPVGAAWGFRSKKELAAAGAAHILNHPLELLQII